MAKDSKQQEPAAPSERTPKEPGALGYKVLAGISATVGATIARKVLTTGWKKATGKQPPANPVHPSVAFTEAASWAAASAAVVAVGRLVAQRRVAATWQRASGEPAPGLEKPVA